MKFHYLSLILLSSALNILVLPIFSQENDSMAFTRHITVAGVGDIMMGTSFPGNKYLPPSDNPWPLIQELAPILSSADITFGNLEGPISDKAQLEKICRDTTICYAFRVPERYGGYLKDAGFDLLSLANNHIGDFGNEGRETTTKLLDSLDIAYAGFKESPYVVVSVDSLTIGFCAFAPNKGTANINDYNRVKAIVKLLDDTCDIVIVSFHGGAEGADYQHVTGNREIFYGEDRGNVAEFARLVIDNGADIVFGHGPHVTRAIDVYKGRFIAYSLGNFLTYRRFNLSGPNGIAPLIKVTTTTSGNFVEAEIIPVYQDGYGCVRIDPNRRVISKIRDLVKTDFPESGITISDNGIIKLK